MTKTLSQPQTHKFIEGQLVRWYEYYADGDIVKDAGIGRVISVQERVYCGFGGKTIEYQNFEVYRNKFNDIIVLNENDIESL